MTSTVGRLSFDEPRKKRLLLVSFRSLYLMNCSVRMGRSKFSRMIYESSRWDCEKECTAIMEPKTRPHELSHVISFTNNPASARNAAYMERALETFEYGIIEFNDLRRVKQCIKNDGPEQMQLRIRRKYCGHTPRRTLR